MPVLFNQDQVEGSPIGDGIVSQSLINPERVGSDFTWLDRWRIAAGAAAPLEVADTDLAWFQLLEGTATLRGPQGERELSNRHVVFLPPGYRGTLSTGDGAVLLFGGVPDAQRYDSDFGSKSLEFRCVDWHQEPVLDSEHDARKRIYLVTPTLFGTKAIKAEMIIYPPGTEATNHHHEGAEHFQYIISGSGTVYLNEEPHPIRAGDTLYNYEFERHHFISSEDDEDLVFIEYFVPAEFTTVWVNPELACTWLPTGKNVDGGEPVRHIQAHSSAEVANPEGV
jgi:quercetin dioxygenase-like cupin family protein